MKVETIVLCGLLLASEESMVNLSSWNVELTCYPQFVANVSINWKGTFAVHCMGFMYHWEEYSGCDR
jgi:hypothetical protein